MRNRRDTRSRKRRRAGTKRKKGDALVIEIEQTKYSELLKAMRSDAKLVDLGADVRSIRRTRTGDMILELKRDKKHKGAAYESLAEEVLGEDAEVRALAAEETLEVLEALAMLNVVLANVGTYQKYF